MKTETGSVPRVAISRRAFMRVLALMTLQTSASNAAVRVADPSAGNTTTTTSSGLQYYDFILPEDDKPTVESTSTVTVHYTLGSTGARNGWRIDSTYDREPFTFRMGSREVIAGLEEGVLGMRVGGKRRLLIPSNIGYRNANDHPTPKGFAEFQRFKNIYLNPDRAYKPDVVMDVTVLRVR
ncbi:Peptidylprolyl isomerase [Gracilaria domingensis]|nr:Peptidylprolyl isomerase [Gracilaria domingensis]